jgi:glycosyltransferase involved in cell wall biosynthesis
MPVSWVFFAVDAHPTSIRKMLARRIAESDPVVRIERAVSVLSTHGAPSLEQRLFPFGKEQYWQYRPLHFPERIPGFRSFGKRCNRHVLRTELERVLPRSATRIVCYDSPYQEHLARKLGEQVGIYLAIDDRTLTVWGEPIRGEVEAEKRLLSKVDKVICVSQPLADTLRKRMPDGIQVPIRVLPNGYDERMFDPRQRWDEPLLLADIARPRMLVAGHVSERIDWEGIGAASRSRPEWTWVFVGPADRGLPEKLDSLGRQANGGARFVWRPPVPPEQVPPLIAHSDACAVPYRLNPFTIASSPLKGIEYLAMGAPVLSTRVPALLGYNGAIHWVNQGNGDSYTRALDRLLMEGRNPIAVKARCAAVAKDCYSIRVSEFRRMVFDESGI